MAASTAVFPSYNADNSISSMPNALILSSPAVSLLQDKWFAQLLLARGNPIDYSPAEHINENVPPSLILVGKDDTVNPLYQAKLFHNNMLKYDNDSFLHVYDGVGHLFTPSDQPDDGWPNPDKEIKAKVDSEMLLFLKNLGYLK